MCLTTRCTHSHSIRGGDYNNNALPVGPFCPGDLIFEDTFDGFDLDTWQHENTLAGNTVRKGQEEGCGWRYGQIKQSCVCVVASFLQDSEFQWFTNNRTNSFVREGNLFIRPTLTVDEFGEPFLRSGVLNVHGGSPAEQ